MARTILIYRPGHPKANVRGFVNAEDLGYEDKSQRQPVFTDRYMEGVVAPDGTDIGSRSKRKAYMRANNVTDYSDFKGTWGKPQAEHARADKKALRESIERAIYKHNKP